MGAYIIAEAGVNHNGSLDLALKLIEVAADAGTDAVKFQTFKTEASISRAAPKAAYQRETTSEGESQFDMVKKLELDEEQHQILLNHCSRRGIQFLSTPFDVASIDVLAGKLDVPLIKIASGEITNGPLLLHAARTRKPVVLSTGMSTLGDVEEALGVLAFGYTAAREQPSARAFQDAYLSKTGQAALEENVTLLHCTTEYPASFDEVNLRAVDTLRAAFGLPAGLSDHTPGIAVPLAAVARGAAMIEKHFTLDRALPGPDHQASLEPGELRAMVEGIRQVERALGHASKRPTPAEMQNRPIVRKSLVAACSISKGEPFTEQNLVTKRPGRGLSPMQYWEVLDRTARRDYRPDEAIEAQESSLETV